MKLSKMKLDGAEVEPQKSAVDCADRLAYHLEMLIKLNLDPFMILKIKKDLQDYYEASKHGKH